MTPAPVDQPAPQPVHQVVTLSFFRMPRLQQRLWAFMMMGLARWPLSRLRGVGFFKLMGAGTGEGFTPIPDTGAVAILCTWPDLDTARAQVEGSEIFRRYRRKAGETLTVYLEPRSSRGAWSRRAPFIPSDGGMPDGPIVALTRATLRPTILLRFWAWSSPVSRAIGADPNVLFKAGLGEVPWIQQMTFSVWPDADSMAAFARRDGPHAQAIRAVREGKWFAEELYARFALLDAKGSWGGINPLDRWRGSAFAARQAAE